MKQLRRFLTSLTKITLKKLTFLKVSRFLFYAFVFLVPFQINIIVYASPLFEGGNFNPFTSVFIYFTDFIFLFALLFWGLSIFQHEYKEKITYGKSLIFILLFLFIIFGELSVLFASDQWLSFNIVIRLVQLVLVYFFIVNKVVKLDVVINVFIATVSVQAVIVMLQYITQGSIGLSLLGESQIAPDINGIAKIDLNESQVIRPYGTFPHPNILAGYLLTGILLTYYRIRQKEHIAYPILFLLVAAFVLAFSRGAFLAILVAGLVFISIKETKLSFRYLFLILAMMIFFVVIFNLEQTIFERFIFSDMTSFNERVFQFNISKQILYAFPLGIGLGNFTLLMPDFTSTKLAPWDFQPVHNIYMLLVNEIGIIGTIIFFLLIISFAVMIFLKMKKSNKDNKNLGAILLATLVSLAVIGLFDHYLISLYHGQILLFLVFGMLGRYLILKTR